MAQRRPGPFLPLAERGARSLGSQVGVRVSTLNGEQLLRCEASSGRRGRLCSYVG